MVHHEERRRRYAALPDQKKYGGSAGRDREPDRELVWPVILHAPIQTTWRFTSIYVHIADFGQPAEITLQEFQIRGSQEIELSRKDSRP